MFTDCNTVEEAAAYVRRLWDAQYIALVFDEQWSDEKKKKADSLLRELFYDYGTKKKISLLHWTMTIRKCIDPYEVLLGMTDKVFHQRSIKLYPDGSLGVWYNGLGYKKCECLRTSGGMFQL